MKRRLLIVFGVAAVLAILSTGTLAYVTVDQPVENVVTAGSVKVEIHEKMANGEDFPKEGINVLPGDTVSKIVTFENVGTHPMYLRVKLAKGVNDENLSAEDCLIMDINTKNWTYKDGYYYYNHVIEAGRTTDALMTEVHIDGWAVDNAYLGKKFTLDVTAEAVQSEYNGNTVWEAVGWDAAADNS